ncbi:hypothetical protein ACN28S_11230 [Cystobacter fuscus]
MPFSHAAPLAHCALEVQARPDQPEHPRSPPTALLRMRNIGWRNSVALSPVLKVATGCPPFWGSASM